MTVPAPFPRVSTVLTPMLPTTSLTEDEKATVTRLQSQWQYGKARMEIDEAYYLGEQVLTTLGIAIPPELQGLRTVIGWPSIAVDPIEERLTVQGFRRRGSTDVDQDLYDLWDANNLQAEQSPLHLDALMVGSGWYTIGPGDAKDDPAMIRVESSLNMWAEWDPRTLRPKNVLQQYWAEGSWHAVLYTPTNNVYMDADPADGTWKFSDREPHRLGRPLAVRLTNRPRTRARDGSSEITLAVRNLTDAACRALLNLQVAGEFYSIPQKYILGATEADFQKSDGTVKSAWEAYVNKVLALERDENGEIPTVGQFTAYDPATFTKVLDFYAAKMAGLIGATPQDLGLYTEGNPPSADSVEFADGRKNRKAKRKQSLFGPGHIEALQIGFELQHGSLPEDMRHLEVEWEDPAISSFASTAAAISQLTQGDNPVLPATSDVTLSKLGFTPIQRQRLEQDRQVEQAQNAARMAALAAQQRLTSGNPAGQ